MIFDKLTNAAAYKALGPRFQAAFEFFESGQTHTLAPGRHELDGERLFVNVEEYTSKPVDQGKWEAHRKYADIQLILSGRERMDYAPIDTMREVVAYDPEKDAAFFEGEGMPLIVEPGMFAVFLPHDVHRPNLAPAEPAPVRKAVAKVLLES